MAGATIQLPAPIRGRATRHRRRPADGRSAPAQEPKAAPRSVDPSDWSAGDAYLHYDQAGSVAARTDADGDLASRRFADAFGNEVAGASSVLWAAPEGGWGHAGGAVDADSGLLYAGGAWIDTRTGIRHGGSLWLMSLQGFYQGYHRPPGSKPVPIDFGEDPTPPFVKIRMPDGTVVIRGPFMDSDNDGVPDGIDINGVVDSDNDGWPDEHDPFPLDPTLPGPGGWAPPMGPFQPRLTGPNATVYGAQLTAFGGMLVFNPKATPPGQILGAGVLLGGTILIIIGQNT